MEEKGPPDGRAKPPRYATVRRRNSAWARWPEDRRRSRSGRSSTPRSCQEIGKLLHVKQQCDLPYHMPQNSAIFRSANRDLQGTLLEPCCMCLIAQRPPRMLRCNSVGSCNEETAVERQLQGGDLTLSNVKMMSSTCSAAGCHSKDFPRFSSPAPRAWARVTLLSS